MQQLESAEQICYTNKQTNQKCRLSQEVDDEKYETYKEVNRSKKAEEAELNGLEQSFINDTYSNNNITQHKWIYPKEIIIQVHQCPGVYEWLL